MPKRQKTPEERAAWREKMVAAKEAKRKAGEGIQHPVPGINVKMDGEDVRGLLRRLEELEGIVKQRSSESDIQVTSRGLVGTLEKYVIDPAYYPNPTKKLSSEQRLQRFAFPDNYELGFEVTSTQYQTLDGINTREPKFTLKLIRKMLDEDDGTDTGKRYMICQAIFHEDPQAAITIAREQGIDVDSFGEKDFLDEMRYLRMRDWLFEAFYPPKSAPSTQRRETVIGNRLVEVFEVNSETSQVIPFGQLTKKL